MTWRLFYAVPIPEEARRAAGEALEALRRTRADYKWVEPENLHFTLSFLGGVPEDKVPKAKACLDAASFGPAFEAKLGVFGAFPGIRDPRIVWIGLSRGAEEMSGLAAALRSALGAAGILPAEEGGRPFHAHLTLGRRRTRSGVAGLQKLIEERPSLRCVFPVKSAALYRSFLSTRGPAYETLAERELK